MAPPRKRRKLLSSTRPPHASSATTLSAKAARTTIREHHALRKTLRQRQFAAAPGSSTAVEPDAGVGPDATAVALASDLPAYQAASLQGQSRARGGDSSRVLVEWLAPAVSTLDAERRPPRLLEVGALRVDNACARGGRFAVERIDLRAQHPAIRQQDFMQRPAPASAAARAADGFDVVSLSLVLNFVEEPAARGEMLRRVGRFLRGGPAPSGAGTDAQHVFPGLFLVLPAPCVQNSRYLDEERLEAMMRALGYEQVHVKQSAKLVYYYYRYLQPTKPSEDTFPKKVLRPGGGLNNFAIVLR